MCSERILLYIIINIYTRLNNHVIYFVTLRIFIRKCKQRYKISRYIRKSVELIRKVETANFKQANAYADSIKISINGSRLF